MDAHVTEPAARNALAGVLAVWFLLIVAGTGIALAGGLRINLSSSMPAGIYRLTAARIERGALVAVCPALTLRRCNGRGNGVIWPQDGAVTGVWLPC